MEVHTLIGNHMRILRTQHGLTQAEVAQKLHIDRSVYAKHESGKTTPNQDRIHAFADIFQIPSEKLLKQVSIAIPDTSSLLKNKRIFPWFLEDFQKVIVPQTVIDELSYQKNYGRNGKDAWMVMKNIYFFLGEYPERVEIGDSRRFAGNHDSKIIQLAKATEKEHNGTVFIIHDDIDISLNYHNSLLLKDYLSHRCGEVNYPLLWELQDLALEDWSGFSKELHKETLNGYLQDGQTLLIHCIRSKLPPSLKEKKLKFLLQQGADVNKTDHHKHCLTPLSHCIQTREFRAFELLIAHGADYNKGSLDETAQTYFKNDRINEGNTPLMIAAWQGSLSFVKKLCVLPEISLNQQDSNGYTALIKCGVKKQIALKSGKSYEQYEKVYEYLRRLPKVDPLIHDRNQKRACDWWEGL